VEELITDPIWRHKPFSDRWKELISHRSDSSFAHRLFTSFDLKHFADLNGTCFENLSDLFVFKDEVSGGHSKFAAVALLIRPPVFLVSRFIHLGELVVVVFNVQHIWQI